MEMWNRGMFGEKRQQFGQQCDSTEATICLLRMVKVIDRHWFVKFLLTLDCRSLL